MNCRNILELQNYDLDNNRILSINNSNYILLYEPDNEVNYIYIQGYRINNNKDLKLLDYQTIEVSSEEIYQNSFDKCKIFKDNHGMDIYFLFYDPLVLLVLSKEIINNEEIDFTKEIIKLNDILIDYNNIIDLMIEISQKRKFLFLIEIYIINLKIVNFTNLIWILQKIFK